MNPTAHFTVGHHSLEPLEARIAPATFIVTSLADDGSDGTLRHEIADANTAGGKNSIVFKAGLHGTIALNSGALSITSDLTIKGPGGNKIILHGESDRIFTIDTHSVTLSGLALMSGQVTGNGGAISSLGSLAIVNCTIAGSVATDGFGGAIYDKTDGSFLLKNSVISGNSIASSGNSAYSTYSGGGVNADVNGGIAIINSKIIGNTATGGSGGLLLTHSSTGTGNIVISGSFISGNKASDGAVGGLGIGQDTPHGQVKISTSVISGNTATSGAGGIYLGIASSKAATITGVIISNNSGGGGFGGGLDSGSGKLVIQNSQILGNTAYAGGGIFAERGLTIINSKILNNQATNFGGGVDFSGGSDFLLSHSTVSGNETTNFAGGLMVDNKSGSTRIIGSVISQNTAGSYAGGALLEGAGAITVTSSTITGNVAKAGNGGGLDIVPANPDILLKGNTITNNTAASGDGGGVSITNNSTFKIIGGTIAGNEAETGGGVYLDSSTTGLIQGTVITGNSATGLSGGGGLAHVKNGTGVLTITKPSLISGNVATSGKADTYGSYITPGKDQS